MAELPHFAFPFERANGKVKVVEQDSEAHVMSCERSIAATPLGYRDERPDFGIPMPDYRTRIDLDGIEQALRTWEPRSRLSSEELLDLVKYATGEREAVIEVEAP